MDISEKIILKYSSNNAQQKYDIFALEVRVEMLEEENKKLNEDIEKLKKDEVIGEQVKNILEEEKEEVNNG